MMTYRTIIIDDERIARQRLKRLLSAVSEQIEIIAEAKNGIEGATLINELKPDLIFLDIQMPGRTGFEMLSDLTHTPHVVFCTAYEEFALQAFNTLAIDYLVKPVEEERLELTFEKLNSKIGKSTTQQIAALLKLVNTQEGEKKIQSVPYKIGDRVILIKTDKITHFEAKDKYVEFYTREGKKYLSELSLKKLSTRLPENFKQFHRSLIVNTNFIKEFRKYFRGKYLLILDDQNSTRLETGRSYANTIKEYLSIE